MSEKWFFLPIVIILSTLLVFQPIISYANINKIEKEEKTELEPMTTALLLSGAFFGAVEGFSYWWECRVEQSRDWNKVDFIIRVTVGVSYGIAVVLYSYYPPSVLSSLLGISLDVLDMPTVKAKLADKISGFVQNTLSNIDSPNEILSTNIRKTMINNKDKFNEEINSIIDENYTPSFQPAFAEFITKTIDCSGINVIPHSVEHNESYGGSWRMRYPGTSKLEVSFDLNESDRDIILSMFHLTSSSSEVPSGGYSPVDLLLNGTLIVNNFDPAQAHNGLHSFVKDSWQLPASKLQTGTNNLIIEFEDDPRAETHYWIKGLSLTPGLMESERIKGSDISIVNYDWQNDDDDDRVVEVGEKVSLKIKLRS